MNIETITTPSWEKKTNSEQVINDRGKSPILCLEYTVFLADEENNTNEIHLQEPKDKINKAEFPHLYQLRTIGIPVISAIMTLLLVLSIFAGSGMEGLVKSTKDTSAGIMDRFDMYITNEISKALDGVFSIEKVYWLNDKEKVAPEPNQECYGETDDPATLQWLLDEAAEILDGQDTLFTTETPIFKGTKVTYYLDETIFAITWKEQRGSCMYTFSEVKIAHPSQFRRFLSGGEYGSEVQTITTEMAASVNAVVASSGDFYQFRRQGLIVYEGEVMRNDGVYVDTCCIDDKGDLIFVRQGEILDLETAKKFVEDNNIRFSIAFGPILVENGVRCEPWGYALGEVNDKFPRAALCQRDELHYVVVVSNMEHGYNTTPTIHGFAAEVATLGCDKAYTLDGGQTCVIAMNDQLINAVHFGSQRKISDIFYFATAIPNRGS